MSERNLGLDIKLLRSEKGIGSRELSRLIRKAETYVSQLERGLIKNPDYDTVVNIFKILGHEESDIEDFLYHVYFIESPERIEAQMKENENALTPEYQQYMFERSAEQYEREQLKNKHNNKKLSPQVDWLVDIEEEVKNIKKLKPQIDWLVDIEEEVKNKNEMIKRELSFFIDKKFDTFSNVINNFYEIVVSMRRSKENYDFFTNLFKYDLSKLNEVSKKRIIETINEELRKLEEE